MAYATEAELAAYPVTVPAGVNAALLLTRASRDVDRALLCSVYDPDDPDVIAALRDATCEQVAGNLAVGDTTGTGTVGPPVGFTLGRLSVQQASSSTGNRPAKVGRLWQQAWQILQDAGLTGQGPHTC